MRKPLDRARIQQVMEAFGRAADHPLRIYFAGGVTAVMTGWRASTVDIDLQMVPEDEGLMRAIPNLKNALDVNVELATPGQFIPIPAGWEARSIPIGQSGNVRFFHLDPYAQALAKLERGHARDASDVRAMHQHGFIDKVLLMTYFEEIEPVLYRFPAVDPARFRRAVELFIAS